MKPGKDPVHVEALHIVQLPQAGKVKVGHTNLLALVDKGRTPEGQEEGGQELAALCGVGLAAKPGDGAGLVVVFQIQGVPGQGLLPLGEAVEELFGAEFGLEPLDKDLVALHVLKGKHHVQLMAVQAAEILGLLGGDKYGFAYGKSVVLVPHLPQLPEDGVGALQGEVMLRAGEGQAFALAFQAVLPENVDDVAAKARHALVQPEAHDVLDLRQHRRVVVVEVRLGLGKEMEVVLAPLGVKFPAVLPEKAGPVVGELPTFPAVGPVIVVGVGAGFVPALAEPVMLRGGVVDDQVHDNADVPAASLGDEPLHVRHGTVLRVDVPVVADVVAVVGVGGAVYRGEPDGVGPQVTDVVQTADDAGNVPDTVAVGILEAPGIDLIDDRVFPPCHGPTPPRSPGIPRRSTAATGLR